MPALMGCRSAPAFTASAGPVAAPARGAAAASAASPMARTRPIRGRGRTAREASAALPRCGGVSTLWLPEGDLTARRGAHDAPPPRRALAPVEQAPRPEAPGPVRGGADLVPLDVGQPQRARDRALDDAAARPVAHAEGLVGAVG